MSRPARAAWIEMARDRGRRFFIAGRGPHGPRGLKFLWDREKIIELLSRGPHGPRGLKFRSPPLWRWSRRSRGPHGPRGLKSRILNAGWDKRGRGPHGPRGLKFIGRLAADTPALSRGPHGPRGLKSLVPPWLSTGSRCRGPHGPRGLKFRGGGGPLYGRPPSRPARAAWIEISFSRATTASGAVAARTGRVD